MTELEMLQNDLDNLITGMAICRDALTEGERECFTMLKRCKSVIDRIRPSGKENDG